MIARTNFLSRWLLRRGKHAEEKRGSKTVALRQTSTDKVSLIQSFIGGLEAEGHQWTSKIRLINFESFRDRLGPIWPKIRPKVELLAEKFIRDQMSEGDRCIALGESEFLVFYANAGAEEIRIRCVAIVEAIQQKLFGVADQLTEDGYRFAEVHVPNDDLALVWERAQNAKQRKWDLGDLFQKEPERPDVADIAASAQKAIESLILRGEEGLDAGQAHSLRARLKRLAQDIDFLGRSLLVGNDDGPLTNDEFVPLREVRDDTAELENVFDENRSPTEIVEALAALRKARAERFARRSSYANLNQPRSQLVSLGDFHYLPVLRCVSNGDQIHQAIFRVTRVLDHGEDGAAWDLLAFEHALNFWAENNRPAQFLLMVPVHAETLRSPHWYHKYSTLARTASRLAKRFVVLEVIAGEDAPDSLAMRRAIEELKAHFLAIFVAFTYQRAAALENAAVELKKSGVHALGVEFSQAPESSATGVLKKISLACKQNGLSSYAADIRNFTVFAEAALAGIGYASAPVVSPPRTTPSIERTSFERLYHAASRTGRATTRQVLLADDESMFRDAVADFLKAAGFEVFDAPNGEEALAVLKKHPHISLLISDVRMPHMDGFSLVQASLGLKPELKVIMMTGYAASPSKFVQDRNIETIQKPFDLKMLSSRVQNITAPQRTTMLD